MRALILSSFVAADAIGGGAQKVALEGLGFEACLVPTALFGRSPAKGGRGRVTEPVHFTEMIEDAEAEGFLAADLFLTGHFSHPAQVEAAAATLRRKTGGLVVVDPVLGDAPRGLYVKPEVADALEALLLPLADWITPNVWELSHLTGLAVTDAASAGYAARQLEPAALVTSAPVDDDRIGVLVCGEEEPRLMMHQRLPQAPNGTGDFLAAAFGAGLARGEAPADAAAWALAGLTKRLFPLGADVLVEPLP